MQCPLIPAMTSLSMRSIAVIASSHRIRSGCVSSPAASALRSTPVWNARPAPVITTTRTSRRASSVATASPSSVAKRALPAFNTCGRSKVMRATSPCTVSRIVASVMGQWFTIKTLVTSLTALLCLSTFCTIVSSGAFPAVVPDIARSAALADWQLGIVAGAYGFARMVAAIPLGLFLTHSLRRALWIGPLVLAIGGLCVTAGGGFPTLVLGRSLMGLGQALGMMAALTAILRFQSGKTLASALAAYELSTMIGMLADRQGAARVLPGILLLMATASAMIGFGALPVVIAGCALCGLSMSVWMLPLSLLRQETEPERIAWRTGLYRVGVDGGIFLGPFLSGVLGMRLAGLLPALSTAALAVTALLLLARARSSGTMAIHG